MKRSSLALILFCCFMLAGITSCDKFLKKEDPAEIAARSQHAKAMRAAKNYVDTWNKRDAKAVAALYTEDASVYMSDMPKPVQGRAEIEKNIAGFFQAFPDLKAEAITTAAEGNKYIIEGRMTGTNSGPMKSEKGEMPATNNKIDIRFAMVETLNDSLISEDHTYFNPQDMEKQLYPNGMKTNKTAVVKKKKRRR